VPIILKKKNDNLTVEFWFIWITKDGAYKADFIKISPNQASHPLPH
jgi:hypothetical protein